MEQITSLQNKRVKEWCSLHQKKYRDQTGRFLVEGEHLIKEALTAGLLEELITDTESPFDFRKVTLVTPQIMAKISKNVSAVHLIGVCRKMEETAERRNRFILLDGIQDPGNLGTLIRTAVSFGFDAVYCSEDTCDLFNEKAVRSTQGALFHIPIMRRNLKDLIPLLQKEGFAVISTSLEESHTPSQIAVTDQMAFVFGNEGQGVRKEIQAMSDDRLRIEITGFESLNVAVAGGIVMYLYRGRETE